METRYRVGLAILGILAMGFSQTEIYKPYKKTTGWTADTLYIGAELLYSGVGAIQVTLKASESVTRGKLYFINPASNDTVFLFDNKAPLGTTVDAGKSTAVPKDGPVVFMYIPENHYLPMFTGPNLVGSRFRCQASSDSMTNPNWRYGHRWSVVGRTPAGDLEVGFEDWIDPGSDMDFDDVIFQIKGVNIAIRDRSLRTKDLVR